ncbi:MAG TPA: hypothetical protein VHW60_15465 [Caulobacteraceae bacterium]|nr:hypothetical protein [Caulobacteraceae bacterium]
MPGLTVSASGDVRATPGREGPLARALGRLTPREAWLLAGMCLVALVVAAFYALEWSSSERDRYAAAQADLTLARQDRAIATQRGAEGVSNADASAAGAWSLHARNLWLARLKIEQALSAAATSARLPSPQIKIAQALEDNSAAPLLKAEVSGPYVAGPWVAFMRALAGSGLVFVIDKLDVSDADTSQYSLTLLLPVALDEAPAEASPTP